MPDRPNIVLICVDQWRADCLSVAGHPVVQTPFIDRLAGGGARMNRAYTATPTCIPARAALLTGLSQRRHGRVGYRDGVPWNYDVTMPGEFTRHGYQTQCIGKMHVYPERSQMGFQNVLLHDGYLHFSRAAPQGAERTDDYLRWLRQRAGHDADYLDTGLNCNSYNARPWDKAEELHPTNWMASESIDFLRRRDIRKPFFLFMSFHRPHPPLDPPAWAMDQYLHRQMPKPPVGDWAAYFEPQYQSHRPDLNCGIISEDRLQRARAGYYGHLTHIDGQIYRFLESLHEYGLEQNTVVCFVSDHGDLMGDHHLFRKSLPYEGAARVPLILTIPGSGIRGGTTCDAPVELRDVMPTLLDCAGLPAPDSIDGKSFLPLLRGDQPAQAAWRPHVHGEHTHSGVKPGAPQQSVHYLTDGKEKYIWFSGDGHEQLFDLVQDPLELHDLAPSPGSSGSPSHAQKIAQWRAVAHQRTDGPRGRIYRRPTADPRPARECVFVVPATQKLILNGECSHALRHGPCPQPRTTCRLRPRWVPGFSRPLPVGIGF